MSQEYSDTYRETVLLPIAIDAAEKAGDAIMDYYEITNFDTKHDGSPVTIADHTSNNIVTEMLRSTHIALLSEEALDVVPPYPELLWVVDPLDGTKDFIQKTDDFSVMIGLLENGRPVLGVVYIPTTGQTYYASKGMGTFCKEKDGTVRQVLIPPQPETPFRAIRSRNHHSARAAAFFERLGATLTEPRGSVGIKATVIAEGKTDLYIVSGYLGIWDTCAPEVILTEAGGIVLGLTGALLNYGGENHKLTTGTVFAHPGIKEKVFETITAIQSEESAQSEEHQKIFWKNQRDT